MTDLRNDILVQMQETLVAQAAVLGRIEGKMDSLAGPEGRVTKLEQYNSSQAWKSWAKSLLAPVLMLVGHGVSRKLGLDV